MPSAVRGFGFRGMSNLPRTPAKILDDSRMWLPTIVLNALVYDDGMLLERPGYQRKISLPEAHSLWSGSAMLCVGRGSGGMSLFRVEGQTLTELCPVEGSASRLNYVEVEGLIYLSNPSWTGVCDPFRENVRPWGLARPPLPAVEMVAGDLPAGNYHLCYTGYEEGRLGGNGPVLQVRSEGGSFGLRLLNLPATALCWITQANGEKLFLAGVEADLIQDMVPQGKPLPSLGVGPPPPMTCLAHAFGRIWGGNGKRLYYSDSFFYEWFRAGNFLPFPEEPVMVAPAQEGIFVNSLNHSWYLRGTDPAKMRLDRVGDGAVPGTLTYAQVEGGGYEISKTLSQLPSPLWVGRHGVVVGTNTGHLVHLTEGKAKMNPRQEGAACFLVRDGIPQIITTLQGPPINPGTDDLKDIRETGNLFQ